MSSNFDYEIPPPKPDLPTTLAALQASQSRRPDKTIFYGLSDLSQADIEALRPVWETLPPAFRRKVMRELAEVSESNFEMDYRAVGLFGLQDTDPGVREGAIEILWEDESLELMSRLVDMALHDDVVDVRASAVAALGRFILMGELGDIPQVETLSAQDAAVQLLTNEYEDVAVRRRALEAISNCSHDIVRTAIKEAYYSPYQPMRVSAVYAMGRTCDEAWEDIVLAEIESSDAEMRYEAARASGELGLSNAVPKLAQLILDDDREIMEVVVWSLGEIGTKEAIRILNILEEKAEEDEDEDLLDAIEEALGNASLGESFGEFRLD